MSVEITFITDNLIAFFWNLHADPNVIIVALKFMIFLFIPVNLRYIILNYSEFFYKRQFFIDKDLINFFYGPGLGPWPIIFLFLINNAGVFRETMVLNT